MPAEEAARTFSECLIRFIHYLRLKGFSVTSTETVDAFRALEVLDLSDETEVRLGLRAVLCSTRAEHEAFDALLASFFRELPERSGMGTSDNGRHGSQQEKGELTQTGETTVIKDETASETKAEPVGHSPHGGNPDGVKERSFLQAVRQSRAASHQTTTARVPSDNFAHMLAAAKHVIRHIRLSPEKRWHPVSEGHRIDLRRTMRRSISTGGYPVDPARSGHRKQKARFVLLCDGSRSMAPYAGTFLQFACALNCQTRHTELYLFSTRVRRVTHVLQTVRPPNMPSFTQLGAEWGGGTRIGESLVHVIRDDGSRLLSANTVVMIFSDGLDSGDPDKLKQAMRVFKQRTNRVIWLNPLASTRGFEPKARGMQAALPYVDLLSEAHDATSFYQLAQRIGKRRGPLEGKQRDH